MAVRHNIKEIRVGVCESSRKGRTGYYAFHTYEEANAFLAECASETCMMGGDKNDVVVEWTDGETYAYTTSLSNPRGISRDSEELRIEMRIANHIIYRLTSKHQHDKLSEESRAEYMELLEFHYFGDFSADEVSVMREKDKKIREENKARLRMEYEIEYYAMLKTHLLDCEELGGGKLVEGKGFKSTVKIKRGEFIELSGTSPRRNPETASPEELPFKRVFKIGQECSWGCGKYDTGEVVSFTEKTVTVKDSYRGNKRVRMDCFSYYNIPEADTKSMMGNDSYILSLIY